MVDQGDGGHAALTAGRRRLATTHESGGGGDGGGDGGVIWDACWQGRPEGWSK